MASAEVQTSGTVKPASPFDPEKDCEVLRKAMKGMGTDERAIIDVLGYRSNAQRQQIKMLYKTMFGRDIVKDLRSELGGRFEDAIVGMMLPPDQYDASECKRAIDGLGTDEDDLIEIMCTRSNQQTLAIKAAYKLLFKRDLEKDLIKDTSGDFRKLMVSVSTGGRMEDQPVDMAKASSDAQRLYQAGEKKWGTDESMFNRILCVQSYPQLRACFNEYQKISKRSIEQAIKSEMSGNLEIGMLAIVKCVQNTPAYFAEKMYKSMKGAGTKDRDLIRAIVTRSEVDLVQIKQEFQRMYGKTLESFISGDCSGDYKKILLALVRSGY